MKLFLTIFSAILAAALVIWFVISIQEARKHHAELVESMRKANHTMDQMQADIDEDKRFDAIVAQHTAGDTNSTAPPPAP